MSGQNEETILSEVIAASLGGAISASILYPLEVLKTKMQAADNNSSTSSSCEESEDIFNGQNEDENDPNTTTTENKMIKKNDNTKNTNMISFANHLYQKEGYNVFIRGIETSALQSAIEKALYFFAYTGLKDSYYYMFQTKTLNSMTNLLLGCIAEWMHLPITLPIDYLTTRIQTSNEAPMKVLLAMLSDRTTNYYSGLSAYYILCFKPALQYTIYEQVKKLVILHRSSLNRHNNNNKDSSSSLSSVEAFLLGMIARTISTILVFPFIRAKVLLQTQKKQQQNNNNEEQQTTTPKSSPSILDILLQEYKQTGGISRLYQGIGPELTRGIFSSAIMLMMKEKIAEIVRNMVIARQR